MGNPWIQVKVKDLVNNQALIFRTRAEPGLSIDFIVVNIGQM